MLSLTWVPTADNTVADAIYRTSRDTIIRMSPSAFRRVRDQFGPFNIDLIACNASAQRSPLTGLRLPFFSRYDCEGSLGRDVLAQNVAVVPPTGTPAFGFCFPLPVMVGHVLQHLSECRARAVVIAPSEKAYWTPLMHSATVRSTEVAARGANGCFLWPSPTGSLRDWQYTRYAVTAFEVDFR
ncbi:unnamed protein product [Pylaiella littoralis]